MKYRPPQGMLILVLLLVFANTVVAASDKPKKSTKQTKSTSRAKQSSGPNTKKPDQLLELWSDGPAIGWRKEGAVLYLKAESAVAAVTQEKESLPKSKGQLTEVGQAHVLVYRTTRLSSRLKIWVEPVGIDLALRCSALYKSLLPLEERMRKEFADVLANNYQAFVERCKKQETKLQPIRKLRDSGKLVEAEKRLSKIFDELLVIGCWYPHETGDGPMAPFELLLSELDTMLFAQMRQEALDDLVNRINAETPQYAEILRELNQASAAIGAGQQFESKDQNLDSLATLDYFLNSWKQLHLQTCRLTALNWIRDSIEAKIVVDHTNQSFHDFQSNFTTGLIKLIEANQTEFDTDVRGRYATIATKLAPALSLAQGSEYVDMFGTMLDRLAGKSPALSAEIVAYREATNDWLRWRARLAVSQARRAAGSSVNEIRFAAELTEPANVLIKDLSNRHVGKQVVIHDLIGSATRHRAMSAIAKDFVFGTAPLNVRQETLTALRLGLLVNEGTGPLSLEAAIALARAERGDLIEVGGEVVDLELEGLYPLWTQISNADWGITRLGQLPPLEQDVDKELSYRRVRLRVQIQPRWYHQPHAFVALESE